MRSFLQIPYQPFTVQFERIVAWRYLRSPRKNRSTSVITTLSIFGIGLGVTALIIALSVMNGFERDLRRALIGANAHITISSYGAVETGVVFEEGVDEQIRSIVSSAQISRYTVNQALLMGSGKPRGALIKGIAIAEELQWKSLLSLLVYPDAAEEAQSANTTEKHAKIIASLDKENSTSSTQQFSGIILGKLLAKNIGARVGDRVRIVAPEARISPIGPIPRAKQFEVVGIYSSGLSGYDEVLAFIDLPTSQKLFALGDAISGISVNLDSPKDVDDVQQELLEVFPFPYYVSTWIEDNENVFSVLQLERVALGIILTLIILVAAFNIISSLIMLVQEKRKDVVILKAMGAQDRSIRNIFMYQGVVIGLVGTVFGLILGVGVCLLIENFEILEIPANVYVNNKIPMYLDTVQLLWICVVSFLICCSVTIFPSLTAARVHPAEGLRHD